MPQKFFPLGDHDKSKNEVFAFADKKSADLWDLREIFND